MKLIKNIASTILVIGFVISFLIFGVITLPFLILLFPYYWIKDIIDKRVYNAYLATIEGTNFFCYNNRKKGFDYVQEEILPELSPDIEILFLRGRRVEIDGYDYRHLSTALYKFKNYTKFPHLLKIRNGKAIDITIYPEFLNCLNNRASQEVLIDKINTFFDLSKS